MTSMHERAVQRREADQAFLDEVRAALPAPVGERVRLSYVRRLGGVDSVEVRLYNIGRLGTGQGG